MGGKNEEFFNKRKELSRYFIKAEGGNWHLFFLLGCEKKKKIGNLFILRVNP